MIWLIALALAGVICFRCVRVLRNMDFKRRGVHYLRWLCFGLSYALLCVAAAGSAIHIKEGHGIAGDWLWLVASAGLIIFDRRARREKTERRD